MRSATFQLTVQPWGTTDWVSVGVSRADYNQHGRQRWTQLSRKDYKRTDLLLGVTDAAAYVTVLTQEFLNELERGNSSSSSEGQSSRRL